MSRQNLIKERRKQIESLTNIEMVTEMHLNFMTLY